MPARRVAPAGKPRAQLYARDYGLSYASVSRYRPLSENRGSSTDLGAGEALFAARHVVAPWTLYLSDWVADLRATQRTVRSEGGELSVRLGPEGVAARWHGGGLAALMVAGRSLDLSAASRPEAALQMTYRVHTPPTHAVYLGVRCGLPYGAPPEPPGGPARRCGLANGAMVDYTNLFHAEPGAWHTLTLPLKCFATAGADLRYVGTPLVLETDGEFNVTVSDARLIDVATPGDCGSGRAAGSGAHPR